MFTNFFFFNFELGEGFAAWQPPPPPPSPEARLFGAPDLHFCHTKLNYAKSNFIFLNAFWSQNVVGIAHAQIRDTDARIHLNACRSSYRMVIKIAQCKQKLKSLNSVWGFSSIISVKIRSSLLKFLCTYRLIPVGMLQGREYV